MNKKIETKLSHSQNFLKDGGLVDRLVEMSSVAEGELVLEIGPGKGIITESLLKRSGNVIAVEADRELYGALWDSYSSAPGNKPRLFNLNFLDFKLPLSGYKVFSNIPFNISADIVKRLFSAKNPPKDCYLVLQKEAAEKYSGLKKESLFSILHKPFFKFSILYNFSKDDFKPKPSVDAVFFRAELLKRPLLEKVSFILFRDFVTFGFSGTKSNLKKNFSNVFSHVQFLRLATDLKFNKDAKPTDLSFEQWLAMFEYFRVSVSADRKSKVRGAHKLLEKGQKGLDKNHRTSAGKRFYEKFS